MTTMPLNYVQTGAMRHDSATILLIDDRQNSEYALAVALKRLGHTVITINQVARGLDMVLELSPEIVFLSLDGPASRWSQVLATLVEKAADTPIITVLEGPFAEKNRPSCLGGRFDCLLLPLSDDDLLRQAVDRALGGAGPRQAAWPANPRLAKTDNETIKGTAGLAAELAAVKDQLLVEQERRLYAQSVARENKRILNIMFNNTHDVVAHLDQAGVVLNINDVIADLFGLMPEDVLGKSLSDHVFLGPDYMQALELYKAASPDISFPVFELEAFHKNGDKVYVEVQAKQILVNNKVEGIINILRDITPHRRLENAQKAVILGMAKLAESRDGATGRHLERIREYVRILTRSLRQLPQYEAYITPDYINDICHSSILHDIGKVGTPDAILLKPGPLTPEEFEVIKRHTIVGGNALAAIDKQLQEQSFLTLGTEIAYYHHEAWDGSGYPSGLKKEKIPLCARIVSIADAYDALTTARVYKAAFSHQRAVDIICKDRDKKFDPDIVDAFTANLDEIDNIRRRLSEKAPTPSSAERV